MVYVSIKEHMSTMLEQKQTKGSKYKKFSIILFEWIRRGCLILVKYIYLRKSNSQQSTYTGDLFWVAWEAQHKYEHPLSWKLICRKDYFLGLVVGEDVEYVLNILPVALSKKRMDLVF